MKRSIGLLVAVCILAGVPISHLAVAKGRPEKNAPTTICHLSPEVEEETLGAFEAVIITIPAHAAEKQKAQNIACDIGEEDGKFCNCAADE